MINKIKSRKALNKLLLQKLFAKTKVLSLFKIQKLTPHCTSNAIPFWNIVKFFYNICLSKLKFQQK